MQPKDLSSRADVQQHYRDNRQDINSMPTSNSGLEEMRQKQNLNQGGYELEARLQARRQETRQTIDQYKAHRGTEEFKKEYDAKEQQFEAEKSKGLIKRSWNKIWK